MTKSTKKVVALTSAIMIAASMSVASMAADYASNPSFNGNGGASSAGPAIEDAVDNAASGNVESAVEEAVSAPEGSAAPVASVKVTSTKALTVSAETISKLADVKGGTLEIKSPKMTITIEADKITNAKQINLSSTVKSSTKQTVLTFASKKDFGCPVKIVIRDCKLSRAKLKKAHLYCDGEDLGPIKLDSAGRPVITVTKGGKYVIK